MFYYIVKCICYITTLIQSNSQGKVEEILSKSSSKFLLLGSRSRDYFTGNWHRETGGRSALWRTAFTSILKIQIWDLITTINGSKTILVVSCAYRKSGFGANFIKSRLAHFSTLFRFLEIMSCFSELGQVDIS